jgi:hypothetical protein
MIETDKADLREGVEVKFIDGDCGLNFPGYSLQPVHGVNDVLHIMKTSSQA